MKLTTFLLFSVCLQLSATGFGQGITISQKNADLETVFRKIEKQTGYLFWYKLESLKKNAKVDVNLKNATLDQALNQTLKNQELTYSIVGNTIVLTPVNNRVTKTLALAVNISGIVTDEKGEPMPGVTVRVKGVNATVITDANGRFNLPDVKNDAILVFSYIGFVRQEVPVNGQSSIRVRMKENQQHLNELVVVGYGTSTKKDLTGSVGQVDMADFEQAPVRSFDEALAGRIAGLEVTSTEGEPGSGIDITIRGTNSLTQDNSPLYVIDGFPIENPDNNMLNPSEIESIDVLKDASATAIYGARGANGVIIVTTKRGKTGAPVIRYSGYYGIQNNIHEVPLMGPYEFLKLQNEISPENVQTYYLGPIPPVNPGDPVTYQYTLDDYKNVPALDWQHELFRTAPMQNHSLSLSGGTAKTRYSVSGQLFKQDGTIINTGYDRYQGRMTLDQTVNDKLKVGGDISYTNTLKFGTSTSTGANSSMNNFLYSVWGYRPVQTIGTPDEELEVEPVDDLINGSTDYRFNPIMTAKNQLRRNIYNNFIGNAYGEYTFLKGLKLRVTGGLNKTIRRSEAFNGSNTYSGSVYNPFSNGPNGSIRYYETSSWLNENILSYDKRFNKDHRINVVAGITMQGNHYSYYGMAATALPNESLGLSGLSAGQPQPVASYNSDWSLLSGLSRINYTFKDKYLFTASIRADGSSKFAPGKQWSYFPSGAFAWRAINEDFMKKFIFLSNAKVRLSWGLTGNNRVGDYDRYAQMTYPINSYYSFDNTLIQGINITNVGSPDLKWETTEQTDVGLDLGFFKQRIAVTADYYLKNTQDLLLEAQLPYSSGYVSAFKNIGQTRNEGFELSLNTVNIKTKDFSWNTNFNISFNRNKVIALTQNQESLTNTISWDSFYSSVPLYIAKIGEPVGQIYGYIWDGVYQYDDFDKQPDGSYLLKPSVTTNGNTRENIQPGDVKYRDINGDGVVDNFDRTVIGRAYPIHQGGLSNNFRYKNFDLNVFLQWSYGNDIVNANRLVFENGNKVFLNQYKTFEDRWTPENTNTTMPRAGGQYGYVYSTRVVEDGSFLRLKTAALGYTFPAGVLQKVGVKKFRIYTSAQNLITWTKYSGPDPEVSVKTGALTRGFDYSAYPRARTITFGANLTL